MITLNKSIYVGFCISELSKLLMYKFHYDYVLNTFNNVKLLFTDTDSLVYKINDGNVYEQCFKANKVNKAKGVNKKLRHKEYFDVLFNKKVLRHDTKRIQSKLHEIGTYDIYKISLSCFDDKRYVLDDGINTFDYFHKYIKD